MTEHDRGAYTPQPDAPLQFDARGARGGGRRPMPMTLIGSGAVLVVFVGALALHYRHDTKVSPDGAARPVGTPVAQIKAPPPATAQPKDAAGGGVDVFGGTGSAAKAPTIAAAPEAPKPRLTVQTDNSTVAAIKSVPTTNITAPVTTLPLKPAGTTFAQATLPAAKPTTAAPNAGYHAPTGATVAAAAPAKPDATSIVAKVAATPVVKPAATTAAPIKAAAATPVVKTATAAGGAVVQIGAFSSTAQSEKGYADVSTAMSGSMGGKAKRVETVDVGGKTYFRTSIAGFSSRAAADAFCKALAAKGHTCFAKG